ncbi:MaoC/PaaZ C-terminal domain-containing protein [Gordonia neofelifaecis]|uniref:MaoC domain-containing protein dehydratase n=1 Tax=Gordonia neofelifaecis NRRL B-59395 TaxID=644548 RepID=F1YPU2_9ACTN|nr:MaoC/PaaZ C-terminal domain-containing protein [Gordonia neofelifaecis]EGD53272.1 MaoC domain-containing protein dehydratase [Gordonia neofelifaecis NRRL B-59395]
MTKTVTLTSLPGAGQIYPRAVGAMLPVIGKPARVSATADLPDTVYRIENLRIDSAQLKEYCRTTGLQFGAEVPLPYLFVLQFPLAMTVMVSADFPFGAVGAVHVENRIERLRAIGVDEPLTVSTHAENLREHRKGMLVDVISEFRVGRELVAVQTGTFLKQQRTSLSGGERGPAPKDTTPPPPGRVVSVDLGLIRQYANASGDRNPIHMADLTAKAFGFSRAIAHGMWSAAAVLANVEAQLPQAVVYSVRFGKPILLPAKVNMYTERTEDGYDLSILNRRKGYPHLTATTRPRA